MSSDYGSQHMVARRTVKPGRKRRALALAVSAACISVLALPAVAAAKYNLWGINYLDYGGCCGGATLDGSRAYISVSSINPDTNGCVSYSSVVESDDTTHQLQPAVDKCGSGVNIDGTCGKSGFEKSVEVGLNSTFTCYPHGSATLGSSYLTTVDSSSGTGQWYSYIAGTLYEGQSGYTNNHSINEWGELAHSGTFVVGSCPSWTSNGSFTTWQRYWYSGNTWTTVSSAINSSPYCWTTTTVSGGFFTVSR